MSSKRLYRVRKAVSQGQINAHHGNKGRKKVCTRVSEAKTWMERYFNLIGDKMPDKNQIHLPSWDRQIDIYQRFKDDMKEMGMINKGLDLYVDIKVLLFVVHEGIPEKQIVVLSSFYRIWNKDFPHVVIPEVQSTLYLHVYITIMHLSAKQIC